jgi:hypothetical protein
MDALHRSLSVSKATAAFAVVVDAIDFQIERLSYFGR